MKSSGKQTQSTEQTLRESIVTLQHACVNKIPMHLSHEFLKDPRGYMALVTTFVVCPDDLAANLHVLLDQTVDRYLQENGLLAT